MRRAGGQVFHVRLPVPGFERILGQDPGPSQQAEGGEKASRALMSRSPSCFPSMPWREQQPPVRPRLRKSPPLPLSLPSRSIGAQNSETRQCESELAGTLVPPPPPRRLSRIGWTGAAAWPSPARSCGRPLSQEACARRSAPLRPRLPRASRQYRQANGH